MLLSLQAQNELLHWRLHSPDTSTQASPHLLGTAALEQKARSSQGLSFTKIDTHDGVVSRDEYEAAMKPRQASTPNMKVKVEHREELEGILEEMKTMLHQVRWECKCGYLNGQQAAYCRICSTPRGNSPRREVATTASSTPPPRPAPRSTPLLVNGDDGTDVLPPLPPPPWRDGKKSPAMPDDGIPRMSVSIAQAELRAALEAASESHRAELIRLQEGHAKEVARMRERLTAAADTAAKPCPGCEEAREALRLATLETEEAREELKRDLRQAHQACAAAEDNARAVQVRYESSLVEHEVEVAQLRRGEDSRAGGLEAEVAAARQATRDAESMLRELSQSNQNELALLERERETALSKAVREASTATSSSLQEQLTKMQSELDTAKRAASQGLSVAQAEIQSLKQTLQGELDNAAIFFRKSKDKETIMESEQRERTAEWNSRLAAAQDLARKANAEKNAAERELDKLQFQLQSRSVSPRSPVSTKTDPVPVVLKNKELSVVTTKKKAVVPPYHPPVVPKKDQLTSPQGPKEDAAWNLHELSNEEAKQMAAYRAARKKQQGAIRAVETWQDFSDVGEGRESVNRG